MFKKLLNVVLKLFGFDGTNPLLKVQLLVTPTVDVLINDTDKGVHPRLSMAVKLGLGLGMVLNQTCMLSFLHPFKLVVTNFIKILSFALEIVWVGKFNPVPIKVSFLYQLYRLFALG